MGAKNDNLKIGKNNFINIFFQKILLQKHIQLPLVQIIQI